jgi:uncharacterized protein (TIGR02611 family)
MLKSVKQGKRLIVAIIGFTVLAVGIAMIVLPGPAILVIPLGLSILATEFVWAKKFLEKVKSKLKRTDSSLNRSGLQRKGRNQDRKRFLSKRDGVTGI